MKTIAFIVGTRPELIKINVLARKLEKKKIKTLIVSSNQQKRILENYRSSLNFDYILKTENCKDDSEFYSKFFSSIHLTLKEKKIDYILVQGDTSTAYCASIYGFLNKIPIIHLEAGLRTYDLNSPWPEEFYRQSIAKLSKIHLAQTPNSKINLKKEGIKDNIFVVGNPGIDYLEEKIGKIKRIIARTDTTVLITMHRRESQETELDKFIKSFQEFAKKNKKTRFYWPVHPNSKIKEVINKNKKIFKNLKVQFLDPLNYDEFLKYLTDTDYVITDSGGVQEEAAYLGKPILIARDKTERVEILQLGLGKIINANGEGLKNKQIVSFLNKKVNMKNVKKWQKIQGSGKSTVKICKVLDAILFK